MVIQLALLVAVHVQPVVAATVKLAAPPAAVADGFVGDTENAQAGPCVTVTVTPAIVIVPVRDEVVVFAAAV
jgi:hypothetical protein